MTGSTICFGCGDPELIPHRGTKREKCGTGLQVGRLLDPMCPVCDAGYPVRRPARRHRSARPEGAVATILFGVNDRARC